MKWKTSIIKYNCHGYAFLTFLNVRQGVSRKEGVNPLPNNTLFFICFQYESFENTVGKGELAHNEQFLLTHSVFCQFGKLSTIFI